MKKYKQTYPDFLLEKWLNKILEERDPSELLRFLLDNCTDTQRSYLIDDFKDNLRADGFCILKCQNLDEQIKIEDFMQDFRPFYNEQETIF
jgi:hypothetical protein